MMGGDGGMFGLFGGGWFLMILFWGLVILAGVVLIRHLIGYDRDNTPTGKASPLDILNEKYARGEMSREEYLEKKADISK